MVKVKENKVEINSKLILTKGGIYYHNALLQGRYYINHYPEYGLLIKVLNKSRPDVIADIRVKMSRKKAIEIMRVIHETLNKDYVSYRLPTYITKGE